MGQHFKIDDFIMHHITDRKEWSIPFLPTIHLPDFLSLHGVMLIVCSIVLILLFCVFYNKKKHVPTGLTNLLEVFVIFIRDQICIASLGEKDGRRMTPLFCTFFFFILGLNLIGLIPLFSTATANVNVTAGLALITLSFMIFGAMVKNGIGGFFKALVPSGVPIPILIILVPIEFLGMFIRAFALMMRLFANMLAGHIVIFAVLGLVVLLGYGALPAVLLAVFINVLEILIAFLQAYIFTLLSAVFIGQMFEPSH